MKDGLYNIDYFWPEELKKAVDSLLEEKMVVVIGTKYQESAANGKIMPDGYKNALRGEIIEALVSAGNVVKVVTKVKSDVRQRTSYFFVVSFCYNPEAEAHVAYVKNGWPSNQVKPYHSVHDEEYYVKSWE